MLPIAGPTGFGATSRKIYRWCRTCDSRSARPGAPRPLPGGDGQLSAEYRPAFRVLARMATDPSLSPNVRGGDSRSSEVAIWGPYGDKFRTVLRSTETAGFGALSEPIARLRSETNRWLTLAC